MTPLWSLCPSIASAERLDSLATRRRPAFEWVNRREHSEHAVSLGSMAEVDAMPVGQVAGVDLSSAPTARWRCTEPGFAPDLVFEGELFASRQLRAAMALPDDTVQWLPVDCSDCPQAMRDADYRLMNLLAFANPMDRQRTAPPEFTDVTLPDGSWTFVWSADPWQPGRPMPHLFWRKNFVPPAPLFRVPGWSMTLATEELAERVMRAGLDDVVFIDMQTDGTPTSELVVRSA